MKKILTTPVFLIYCFILFFILINVYIVFKVDITTLFHSYSMIYLFWFGIIIILKIISHYTVFEEDNHV
jgi:hypothetical protein